MITQSGIYIQCYCHIKLQNAIPVVYIYNAVPMVEIAILSIALSPCYSYSIYTQRCSYAILSMALSPCYSDRIQCYSNGTPRTRLASRDTAAPAVKIWNGLVF